MAGTNRAQSSAVTERLQRLAAEPYRGGFYATLRYLEAVYTDADRLGEGITPSREPVRLGQKPSLAFAPAELAEFEQRGGGQPHRLATFFFGLFGPNGPLPTHLTEYAQEREDHFRDRTFRAFADLFHHRLLSLFFRAWADADPCVSLDRPGNSPFDRYVGATFGFVGDALADRDQVDDDLKRYWAGRLAGNSRPPEGITALLAGYFQIDVSVQEFVGEWLTLRPGERLRLGSTSGAQLGRDALLGTEVWSAQHKFRVICGPLKFEAFTELLPDGTNLSQLRDLVRNYLGDELAWDLQLKLDAAAVPAVQLGQSGRLGWTSWMGERQDPGPADDVLIDPFYVFVRKHTLFEGR